VDLAVHVSAPRAPRPPLRTVIEEAWQTFFTKRAGRAVKYGQQPERTTAGPTGHLVLSMSGYPCRGWRDDSKKQSIIIDITSYGAIFFRPKREGHFRVFMFLRYVLSNPIAFWCRVFFGSFALFARFKCKDRLSSGLAFYSKLLNESLEIFSSWVFCMITQRNLFALVDTVSLFELWILIPQIISHGPTVPPCFTGEGSQFLGLAYSGKQRCFALRVVDFNPSSYSFWLTIPYYGSSHGFRSLESLFFGL
jgi:hypothetical protein